MFNSGKKLFVEHILMIKVMQISSHLQFFVKVHVIFQLEIMFFVLKIV
jgi:hypothetical protein